MDTTAAAFLIQGLALGLSAAASPGPFQAYLINQSLAGGFRRAAPVAFAPLISDGPIVVAILFLLDRLPARFLQAISLAGGAFALYLAWGLWRQWRSRAGGDLGEAGQLAADGGLLEMPPAPGLGGVLGRGVMMNVLSPGPYTFWTLINGPLLLSALRLSPLHAGAFLLGFYGAMLGGMLAIAGLFHQARRLGPRLVRALQLASMAILALFGGVLIVRGVW